MRKERRREASSMSEDSSSSSSSLNSRKSTVNSKRKLPFSENIVSPSDSEPLKEKRSRLNSTPKESSSSLTPRRNTPLSERQQIALLCRLSGEDSSTDTSAPESEGILLKRNERGETALHLATIKGDQEKVHALLKQGVNVNTADFAGWTALHEACNHGWFRIAKILIEFGAEVNALGFEKFTPLHDAAINQHEEIVRLLLKHGANPLQENAKHKTPLDSAGSEKIAQILRDTLISSNEPPVKEQEEGRLRRHRSAEAAERGLQQQSAPTTSQPDSTCTMRKNSPSQPHTQKGADKPTSPRLTLRFQSIRPTRDEKNTTKVPTDIINHPTKYPSYCVTMEAKGDVYDFRKEEEEQVEVSSSQNDVSSTAAVADSSEEIPPPKSETVSSTSKEMEGKMEDKRSEEVKMEEEEAVDEKVEVETVPSKVNGSRTSVDSSLKEQQPDVTEKAEEPSRRKRRKSSDSNQSRHSNRGHKSPSSKNNSSEGCHELKSPKARKRGSQSSSDTESNPSDAEAAHATAEQQQQSNPEANTSNFNGSSSSSSSSSGPHSPKVPPLKIVLPSGSSSLELETRERSKVSSSKQVALPYVVNTTMAESIDGDAVYSMEGSSSRDSLSSKAETPGKTGAKEDGAHAPTEERFQRSLTSRVTRSSQRMQAAIAGSNQCPVTDPSNMVSSSSGQANKCEVGSGESSNDEQMQIVMDVHPRKRKLKHKEQGAEGGNSSASSSNEESHQQLNSYQMYMNIRKQVDKRRRGMFIVHPKPPQGFKDYLLNRCEYVLEGNAASRLSVPMITPPQSLDGAIKDLFVQQEKERYKLRLQHLIEREKLILSVEQEILRVHGRAARAMANQTVPLSACTILKDEEIYNVIEDDKDKNIRSRYNGRLFLSWIQDVNDKWKTIKENMLLRHHNEAESLYAVQKLDWEWKLKELSMVDRKTKPVIDDIFVPMVHVKDEFELLPKSTA